MHESHNMHASLVLLISFLFSVIWTSFVIIIYILCRSVPNIAILLHTSQRHNILIYVKCGIHQMIFKVNINTLLPYNRLKNINEIILWRDGNFLMKLLLATCSINMWCEFWAIERRTTSTEKKKKSSPCYSRWTF